MDMDPISLESGWKIEKPAALFSTKLGYDNSRKQVVDVFQNDQFTSVN